MTFQASSTPRAQAAGSEPSPSALSMPRSTAVIVLPGTFTIVKLSFSPGFFKQIFQAYWTLVLSRTQRIDNGDTSEAADFL